MKESFILRKAAGNNNQINLVELHMVFSQDDVAHSWYIEHELAASLPSNATDQQIIDAVMGELPAELVSETRARLSTAVQEEANRRAANNQLFVNNRYEEYILPDDGLLEAITKVIQTANRVKDEHLEGGVEVTITDGTFTYDTTRSSIDLLNGARVDANARPAEWDAAPKRWRMKGGAWVNLSRADLEAISVAIADHVEVCFNWFEQQEIAAMQCTTVAEAQALRQQVLQGVV